MFIQIITDDPSSWIVPYSKLLKSKIIEIGHECSFIGSASEILPCDVLFILGCTKILKMDLLEKVKYPLVVHESKLPSGKGWSPLSWQILEGKNTIPICLIEASERVDSGKIYLERQIDFKGHELLNELKDAQGKATLSICLEFLNKFGDIQPRAQVGDSTFYSRRDKESSRLDVNKSLLEQFNLLRICDNERYPAHFTLNGYKYLIKISKDEERV